MIDFFEFLNGCSPTRTIVYLIFLIIITFLIFSGVSDIIKRFFGEKHNHFYYYNDEMVENDVKKYNELEDES